MSSQTLFAKFFDDAAIFPPGLAPLPRAVSEHIRRSQDTDTDTFIGPLILPLGKIEEAVALADGSPINFSAVFAIEDLPQLAQVQSELPDSAQIVAVEVKANENALEAIHTLSRADLNDLEVYVELPAAEVSTESIAALKEHGFALKFRTGGVTPELFPSSAELVRVLGLTVNNGLKFKLTAGLHRAIRYTDKNTGFNHFGFLNIAAAVATLRAGEGTDAAQMILDSNDQEAVKSKVTSDGKWRESFSSFGTCSVAEPAETLVELDLFNGDLLKKF